VQKFQEQQKFYKVQQKVATLELTNGLIKESAEQKK